MVSSGKRVLSHEAPRVLNNVVVLVVPISLNKLIFQILRLVFNGKIVNLVVDSKGVLLSVQNSFVCQLDLL